MRLSKSKPKNGFTVFCYLLIVMVLLLTSSSVIASHRTLFTFGKVEVLRTSDPNENKVWVFLRRGDFINDQDLVRIPPRGLLRLKYNDQDLLPTLPGGRETKVIDLIRSGFDRRRKSRNINQSLSGQPALDVLPLESKPIPSETRKKSKYLDSIDQGKLAKFRQHLGNLPIEIITQFPSPTFSRSTGNYPSHNIQLAQLLYPFCTKVDIAQGVHSDFSNLGFLYAQLLYYFKIPTKLDVDQSGNLKILFDSGLQPAEWKKISANTSLVQHKSPNSLPKDRIWLAIQFSPNWNFTTGWYSASQSDGHR